MTNTTIVGTNTLLLMAHNLLLQGDISQEQYNDMVRKNSQIKPQERLDTVILR